MRANAADHAAKGLPEGLPGEPDFTWEGEPPYDEEAKESEHETIDSEE